MKILAGLLTGAIAGAAVGYAVQCSGGVCQMMATPWRGAVAGAAIGTLWVLRRQVAQDRKETMNRKKRKEANEDSHA